MFIDGDDALANLSAAAVPDEALSLTAKYAEMLGSPTLPRVVVRDNVGSRWLGRTIWHPMHPGSTTIELQKVVLNHPDTMERVVAHEVIHHVEFVELTPEQVELFRNGRFKPAKHGRRFHELARRVNEERGDAQFVTEISDQSYVLESERKFLVMVVEIAPGRFGYAYAVKLSPKMIGALKRYKENHRVVRVAESTQRKWSRGPRFGDGRYAVPTEPEEQEELRTLYEAGR